MNALLAPWVVVAVGAGLVLAGVLVGWLLANEWRLYRRTQGGWGPETIDLTGLPSAASLTPRPSRTPERERSYPCW